MIGDGRTGSAGIARRVDRLAVFAALRQRCLLCCAAGYGGKWLLADRAVRRRPRRAAYRGDTLVLETEFADEGATSA